MIETEGIAGPRDGGGLGVHLTAGLKHTQGEFLADTRLAPAVDVPLSPSKCILVDRVTQLAWKSEQRRLQGVAQGAVLD
jgi:hypothetical protein